MIAPSFFEIDQVHDRFVAFYVIMMPLSLTLFADPCHSQLEITSHLLVDVILRLHGLTSSVTLSLQLLNPDS